MYVCTYVHMATKKRLIARTFNLEVGQLDRLDAVASRMNTTLSDLIRRGVDLVLLEVDKTPLPKETTDE